MFFLNLPKASGESPPVAITLPAKTLKKGSDFSEPFLFVRVKGLEPPRLAAPDPKSGASANFATPALPTKHNGFFACGKPKTELLSP